MNNPLAKIDNPLHNFKNPEDRLQAVFVAFLAVSFLGWACSDLVDAGQRKVDQYRNYQTPRSAPMVELMREIVKIK